MTVNLKKWWVWAKNYYAQAQGKENLVINNINILIPIGLTLFIIIGHFIWSWFGDFSNGVGVGIIRNLVLMLASVWAFYGIIVAARRTAALERQVNIQERGQVAERLAKAAEQLSSNSMPIRILAILSLGQIAIEGDKQICQDIIKTLCAYIREEMPIGGNNKSFAEDIIAIKDVLEKVRKNKPDYVRGHINLSDTNLSNADLSGVDLSSANLSGANLSGVDLSGANLSGVDFWDADLKGANLLDADLSDVKGLDTAKNLKTVKNKPQAIRDKIKRRKQSQ